MDQNWCKHKNMFGQ